MRNHHDRQLYLATRDSKLESPFPSLKTIGIMLAFGVLCYAIGLGSKAQTMYDAGFIAGQVRALSTADIVGLEHARDILSEAARR